MNTAASERLVKNLCATSELIPEYWNIFEPIDVPFWQDKLQQVVAALAPSPSNAIRSLVFFVRRTSPRFLLSVDLSLAPFQGTTAHNSIKFDECATGEDLLAQYLPRSILPAFPDYASIPDWSKDTERYKEFDRSYTGKELVELLAKRSITAPFGPYGCLADIHWFNYFGRVYVEAIGKARLQAAGWTRIEEVGDGLACYATEKIDDPNGRQKRSLIAKALEEFVWAPGCKPEQKRTLDFDFSEQFAALPPDVATKLNQSKNAFQVQIAGLSAEEQKQVLGSLEQGGFRYDESTKTLRQSPEKGTPEKKN